MHDSPGRVDVIHASVKKLLGDSRDAAGDFHRPLDKPEHYTIPLYAAPQSAPDVSALVEALEYVVIYHEEIGDNDGNLLMHHSKMMRKVKEALSNYRKGVQQ